MKALGRAAATSIVVGLLATALGMSACSVLPGGRITAGASPYTVGSGVKTTVQRTIGTYHAISAATGVTVVVDPGTAGVASVTADDNLIDQIQTDVRDGTLYIAIEGGVQTNNALRVEVANSDLDAISASTGATVDAESLEGSAVRVETSTGASVRAGGRVASLTVTSSTGGTADLRNVEARTVDVRATAGGSAHVYPTESVTGECTGGATVTIRGTPPRNDVSTDGSSTVTQGQ